VLRNVDDEPQVGLDHPLPGRGIALLDAPGQIDLLLRGEQPHPADLAQVVLHRVEGDVLPPGKRRALRLRGFLVRRDPDVLGLEGIEDLDKLAAAFLPLHVPPLPLPGPFVKSTARRHSIPFGRPMEWLIFTALFRLYRVVAL